MGKYTVFMKQIMTDILRSHKKKGEKTDIGKVGTIPEKIAKQQSWREKTNRQTESPKRDEPNEH